MEALRLPGKFCQVIFFSLRYFQVIYREYRRLSEAMTARAFVPRTNLHTFKTYGYLISMLLVRSVVQEEAAAKKILKPYSMKDDKHYGAMLLGFGHDKWVVANLTFDYIIFNPAISNVKDKKK